VFQEGGGCHAKIATPNLYLVSDVDNFIYRYNTGDELSSFISVSGHANKYSQFSINVEPGKY
jgi:hypothetical protein